MNETTESFCPTSRDDWRKWLHKNHDKKSAVWLIQYKKHAAQPSLSWSDAVDEALCYGWIDSTRRPIDDEKYKQFFCPRKARSNWSKINKDKVERLIAQGRMAEAGLRAIETAKENGSWSYLDKIEALVVPPELEEALGQHPESKDFFESRSKSDKKRMLYWIVSAKREETKNKRIASLIAHTAQKLLPPGLP